MDPVLLAALITQIGIPELMRWLQNLHAENKVITAEEALTKLGRDLDDGDAQALAALASHQPSDVPPEFFQP